MILPLLVFPAKSINVYGLCFYDVAAVFIQCYFGAIFHVCVNGGSPHLIDEKQLSLHFSACHSFQTVMSKKYGSLARTFEDESCGSYCH